MPFTFNNIIPQPNDNISTSQAQILGNFQFLGDTTGNTVSPNPGFYKLPNGLIMQWGLISVSNATPGTPISFATNFSVGIYSIQMTIQKNSSTGQGGSTRSVYVHPGSESITGFTAQLVSTDASNPVYWFVIGL